MVRLRFEWTVGGVAAGQVGVAAGWKNVGNLSLFFGVTF